MGPAAVAASGTALRTAARSAAAGSKRYRRHPFRSQVHPAAIRLTTSSGVNIAAIPPPPYDAAGYGLKPLSMAAVYFGDDVIPEIDIWRAAQLMLKRYGDQALKESADRATELTLAGDDNGAAIWRRRRTRQHHAPGAGPLTENGALRASLSRSE
jgi:hypothetical protein